LLTVRLLAAIQRVRRLQAIALAVGILLEVLVMSVIGIDDSIRGIRGIGGESAALLAVIGAVFAGPWVGVAMAAVGWGLFFPLVANSDASSIVALPVWVAAAYLVGALSAGLLRATRERDEAARRQEAAHALRGPVATIHGLVSVLRARTKREDPELTILRSIEDQTDRLLRSPLFERE
jgi:signal transduction histidine kinase